MSIKDLFNNPGTPKIQKSVTSDELVTNVESSDYVEAKRQEFDRFVPPINFASASSFAKFGSAELYYEKAFERIHNYYPYDGTLAEKVEFDNESSYLDKYVFDNLYPRTNGYLTFTDQYIEVFGGPHTASAGMIDQTFDSTFDLSMKYDEEKKRTSAFEFRGEDGITIEFWLKTPNYNAGQQTIIHVSGTAGDGDIEIKYKNGGQLELIMNSGSTRIQPTFAEITDNEWNHYAVSVLSSSSGITVKGYKNGQWDRQVTTADNIPSILPTTSGLNARIGNHQSISRQLKASLDEFRFWKTARTPEQIFNYWFTPVGGGTNKHDANVALSCYFKFNEGITGDSSLDEKVLDYSGRINNGIISNYAGSMRNTGSAITEKLGEPEFQDPIIYSTHPDVVAKKAEYKTSGSLADLESTSMLFGYFPGWMQEEDEQQGKQLKYLSQVLGSYFDTLWHQINYVNRIHDDHYISGSNQALPFAKKLLYDRGFVMPDLFVDATITENLLGKDDNEVYEKEINEVRNTIYHNIYNNLNTIYKSKGTEKAFRNFFRSLGIGEDLVKLRMYADDSTFVLRNNYELKSFERKFLNFNKEGQFDATLYQTSSANNSNIHIPGDSNYSGSYTVETEIVLPNKKKSNQAAYVAYNSVTASVFGFHTSGSLYTHPSPDEDLSVYVIKENTDAQLNPDDSHRVRFMVTGAFGELTSSVFSYQYENNKWNLAVKVRHENYPYANVTGNVANNYVLEFYGVEADGYTKRNSFYVTSSISADYFTSDKIFYAGAHRTNFTGSSVHNTDVKLGFLRYWHSFLSNDAIDQHAYDPETFGANEPFENDLVNTYSVEIPREKTLALHWAFGDLTGSNASGEMLVSDLSSGSLNSNYGPLSDTIQRYVQGKAVGFNASSQNALDKLYLQTARKRLPDDLMSSDLTTIKSDETEQFFIDDDVSDNFYSFEKSMWGTISDEMMSMFSTALDLNNLIGQPNQKYHHRYNMADFLRDRFFDDVENEPDIEKFTSFYKWIDDSISIAIQQLVPASARFSEKINNVIESHVLERNKYVHQVPILTTFESTEGSIKGISEMKYNWQYGHAPTDPDNEANHTLWQRERKEKDGLRETLRKSRNNHSIQSSGLIRREIDGTARVSDTYAVRRFAKTHDLGIVSQDTIHGGTNFGRKKNLQLFHESIAPAGPLGPISGVPQNVITIGVGEGQGIVEEAPNNDAPPRKKKYATNAQIGNKEGNEYGHWVSGEFVVPMNIMSGTVNSGFNTEVESLYKSGVHIANLHNDVVGNYNETSIQGPFTEQHVGGLQYRHIDLNPGTDNEDTRPEGWGLSIAEHPVDPEADGALGFVGADYEAPYPSSTAAKATRYREEHAKRPVNVRNIKTISGSWKAGNYTNEIQIFSVSPTHQKTWAIEAYNDESIDILPPFIADALPSTTHYQTLMGIAAFPNGNVFGVENNNRQPDTESLVTVEGVAGSTASASTFKVKGKDYVADRDLIRIISNGNDEAFEIDLDSSFIHNQILTGSSDTEFYNNITSSMESNLVGNFDVTYVSHSDVYSKGISFGKFGNIGLSTTSSLGTELDGLNFTFSAWVQVPSGSGKTYYIYHEQTTDGNGQGREIFVENINNGQLVFELNYTDSNPTNRVDRYIYHSFRDTYSGSLNHIAVIKGNQGLGDGANAFLYINGTLQSWNQTSLGTPVGSTTINSPDNYDIGWNTSVNSLGNTTVDIGIIDEVVLLDISCSAAQVSELYNNGRQWDTGSLTEITYSSDVLAYYSFEQSLGDVRNNSEIIDEKGFRDLQVTDDDAFDYVRQVTTSLLISEASASFTITPQDTGNYGNLGISFSGTSFFSKSEGTGGVDAVLEESISSNDNVITIPRTDLTSSERNIVTRFSAPGGPEVQSIGYLDAYTQTYSTHNALPFRNLSVLGSGSGEAGTIRVEDHLGLRRGLKTLRALHQGRFGIDSQYGVVTASVYPSSGSFGKQHRNTSRRMEYSGSTLITGSSYDNMHFNSPIPRSEFQYSWIHAATYGDDKPPQHILGYAPRDGIVSSSAGYVEAIVFPSASSIFAD